MARFLLLLVFTHPRVPVLMFASLPIGIAKFAGCETRFRQAPDRRPLRHCVRAAGENFLRSYRNTESIKRPIGFLCL